MWEANYSNVAVKSGLLLRVVAQDLDAYRRFQVKHLTSLGMVQNVKTEVPMEKIKLTTELPV